MAKTENDKLKELLKTRRKDLTDIKVFLEKRAKRFSKWSVGMKAAVIILGALVATKESFSPIISTSNSISIIIYSLFGVLIAIVTGLETAFGLSTRAGKLAALAVTCRDIGQQIELEEIQINSEDDTANLALQKLLATITTKLQTVQNEAISFGENYLSYHNQKQSSTRVTT